MNGRMSVAAKLVRLAAGVTKIAAGGWSLETAREVVDAIANGRDLLAVADPAQRDLAARLEAATETRIAEWERSGEVPPDRLADARALFAQALDCGLPSPEAMTAAGLVPRRVARAMLSAAQAQNADLAHHYRDGTFHRTFFLGVTEAALVGLLADPEFTDRQGPTLWRGLFGRLDGMDAKLDAILARLPEGLSLAQAQGILADFDVAEITADPARISALLAEKAGELRALQAQLRRLSNDDPDVARLRTEAADLIDRGDFDAAQARLKQARDRDRAAREDLEDRARARRLSEAATEGELGDLARLRLAYREAAGHYAAAAEALPADDETGWVALQFKSVDALFAAGDNFGDIGAIDRAGSQIEAILSSSRPISEENRADFLNRLASTLSVVGARNRDADLVKRSIDVRHDLLKQTDAKQDSIRWGMIATNQGHAYATLGDTLNVNSMYATAIKWYRRALDVQKDMSFDANWIGTQIALANLTSRIGRMKWRAGFPLTARHRFEEAVFLFNDFQIPLETEQIRKLAHAFGQHDQLHLLSDVQIKYADAVAELAEFDRDPEMLRRALDVYDAALSIQTVETMPRLRAITLINKGDAQRALCEVTSSSEELAQALLCFSEARALFEAIGDAAKIAEVDGHVAKTRAAERKFPKPR